jgi:CheY-like chemotaxis protein
MTGNEIEILIVEDNPDDLEMTLRALRRAHLANNIHVARDGAEALEFIFAQGMHAGRKVENGPKVILLDLKLPKVDGLQVLREIKSRPETRPIPVVALTSSREEKDMVACYQLGVNSYIQKPVDFEQFRETIKTIGLYWTKLNEPPPEKTFQA